MLPKIRKVVQYVNSSPLGGVTIDDLAGLVGLSRSRICELFKSEVGITLGRFIKNVRMERARQLLESTTLSVKQILAEVGIADPSHFVRDFRKTYGLSPSRYRRVHASPRAAPQLGDSTRRTTQEDSAR